MTDFGEQSWTEIRDQSFKEPVDVDGNHYVNCHFDNVQMRYAGGTLPWFEQCTFHNVAWYFHGPALRTIQLLQVQNTDGNAQRMLDEMFRPGNVMRE